MVALSSPGARPRLTLFLVGQPLLVREALAFVLEGAGYRVVGQASSTTLAPEQVVVVRPNVVLLYVAGPDDPALALVRQLHRASATTRVVAFLDAVDRHTIAAAACAGVAGYVMKTESLQHLLGVLANLPRGRCLPEVAGGQPASRSSCAISAQRPLLMGAPAATRLTQRQRAVSELVAAGHTNRQIAEMLCLSPYTVRNYLSQAMDELGVSSRAAVAAVVSSGRSDV